MFRKLWALVSTLTLLSQYVFSYEDTFALKETASGDSYRELEAPIDKPQLDTREYAGIELKNGLRAILVSDPSAKASSASLKVNIGFLDTPKDLLGLPHLIEHVISKGSKRYPGADDFTSAIKQTFGYYNAETKHDTTTYYYEMSNSGFDKSLKIFSEMFISPLFHQKNIDIEIEAVESEFKITVANMISKMKYVQGKFSEPKHPFSWFDVGNERSLLELPKAKQIDVRDAMLNFFKEKYSSNLMDLAVVTNMPMEELKSLVVKKFSGIKNLELEKPKHPGPVLRDQDKFIIINSVIPSMDSFLHVQFELPTQTKDVKYAPLHVINSYIGYEGQGSLISLLIEKELATKISSKVEHDYNGFSILDIQFKLNPDRLEEKERILEYLFKTLHLIKLKGITKSKVKELKKLGELKHLFGDIKHGIDLTKELVEEMDHSTPLSKTLWPKQHPILFKKAKILKTMEHLNPRNMRLTFLSHSNSDLPGLKVEPWSNTEYTHEKLDEKLIKKLERIMDSDDIDDDLGLELPQRSKYLPTKFELVDSKLNTGHPVKIYKTKTSTVWHTVGSTQGLKASVTILMCNAKASKTVKHSAYRYIIFNLFNAFIKGHVYEGSVNGIDTTLSEESCGIAIKVTGYSQHLSSYISSLISLINSLGVDDDLLANLVEAYRLDMEDRRFHPLDTQGNSYTEQIFIEATWGTAATEDALESITLEGFTKYYNNFFKFSTLEVLAIGNITPQRAIGIVKRIKKKFKIKSVSEQPTNQKTISLPKGKSWHYNVLLDNEEDNDQSGIVYFLNTNSFYDYKNQLYTALIGFTIKDAAYKVLREQMSLGYYVDAQAKKIGSQSGIAVFVQSDYLPDGLDTSIEAMLSEYCDEMVGLTDDQFDSLKASLKDLIQGRDRDLKDLRDYYWDFILDKSYNFDYEDQLLLQLEEANHKDLQKFLKNNFLKDSKSRRKLTINMFHATYRREYREANSGSEEGVIEDIDDWKDKFLL